MSDVTELQTSIDEPPPPPAAVSRMQALRAGRTPAGVLVLAAVIGAVLVGALGGVYAASRAPAYPAEALVVVLPPKTQTTSDAIPIASVWAEAAGTDAVLGAVASRLSVADDTLTRATTVSAVEGAPLVSIKVATDKGAQSAAWANGVADEVVRQSASSPVSGFTLSVLTKAVGTGKAEGSMTKVLVPAGVIVGALAGITLAELLTAFTRRRPRRR